MFFNENKNYPSNGLVVVSVVKFIETLRSAFKKLIRTRVTAVSVRKSIYWLQR